MIVERLSDQMWIEIITPERAAELLKLNYNNRNMRPNHVARIAENMSQGTFPFTGDPIRYNDNGLQDGQHRLMACVQSGSSFKTLVIYGLPDSVMAVIDNGVSRNLGDTLRWDGVKNAKVVAGVTRFYWVFLDKGNLNNSSARCLATNVQLREFYAHQDELIQWAAGLGRSLTKSVGMSYVPWSIALMHLRSAGNDPYFIEAFVDSIQSGVGLTKNSPVLVLRNWITKNLATRRKVSHQETLIAIVRTWNDWADNRDRSILRILPNHEVPEVRVMA
jgi:hypothetical protein